MALSRSNKFEMKMKPNKGRAHTNTSGKGHRHALHAPNTCVSRATCGRRKLIIRALDLITLEWFSFKRAFKELIKGSYIHNQKRHESIGEDERRLKLIEEKDQGDDDSSEKEVSFVAQWLKS